jgi:prolipoprotein diacylglyceryl transferase
MIRRGGLASHGGVIGGTIGLYLYCLRHKDFKFFWTLDHGIITVFFLASFIRFGNLMNSELCGKVTTVPWAFIFTSGDVHPGLPSHPVVLYESIAYFIMQLMALYLFNKYRDSKPGIYLAFFLVGVFTVRFLLEFYKEPEGRMIFGVISKTQALNLPFIITGLVITYFIAKGKINYSGRING